jgi:hypothetical protein
VDAISERKAALASQLDETVPARTLRRRRADRVRRDLAARARHAEPRGCTRRPRRPQRSRTSWAGLGTTPQLRRRAASSGMRTAWVARARSRLLRPRTSRRTAPGLAATPGH